MMSLDLRFFAERSYSYRGIALHISHGNSHAMPVEFKRVEEGAYHPPAIALTEGAGQELMDELWRAGIRPSEGTGSAGALAATQNHLKDMQRIAFRLLDEQQ